MLTKHTHRNTIRMAPPFIIERAEIDWAVDRIEEALEGVCEDIIEPLTAF
jgi:ornithine--oxo-acid transaminase